MGRVFQHDPLHFNSGSGIMEETAGQLHDKC